MSVLSLPVSRPVSVLVIFATLALAGLLCAGCSTGNGSEKETASKGTAKQICGQPAWCPTEESVCYYDLYAISGTYRCNDVGSPNQLTIEVVYEDTAGSFYLYLHDDDGGSPQPLQATGAGLPCPDGKFHIRFSAEDRLFDCVKQ